MYKLSIPLLLFTAFTFINCQNAETQLSSIQLSDILAKNPKNFYLVDVRTPEEFKTGRIPGAININYVDILITPPTLNKTDTIVVYCRTGNRSLQAKNALTRAGYTNVINFGGISNWKGSLVY